MKRILALVAVALLIPICAAAGEVTTRLVIDGMHCALCAPAAAEMAASAMSSAARMTTKIVRTMEALQGDRAQAVTDTQAVVVADESVKTAALIAAVAKAGFSTTVAEEN